MEVAVRRAAFVASRSPVLALGAGLVLLSLFSLALVQPMLARPYVYDEISFAQMGDAIAETGVPFANVGFMVDRGFIDRQQQFGLWHPPLYLYALGLAFKLFSSSEQTARLLGFACMVLTALFTLLAVRTALRDHPNRDGLGLFAAIVYVLNPLTLQSALLLDIDGSVLTVLMMALVWLYLRSDRWGISGRFATGLLFAVALAAKMTTPFFLLPAIVARRVLQGRLDRGLGEAATIGIVGAMLFFVGWRATSWLLGLPFEMPFEVLYVEFADAAGYGLRSLRTFDAVAGASQPALRWIGPFLPLTLIAATVLRSADHFQFATAGAGSWLAATGSNLVRRVSRPFHQGATQTAGTTGHPDRRGRRLGLRVPGHESASRLDGLSAGQGLDLMIVLTWAILVAYLVKTAADFPKYHVAAVPPLAAVAALLAGRVFRRLGRVESLLHPAILTVLLAYFFFEVGERYVNRWDYMFLAPMLVVPGLVATPALVLGRIAAGRIWPQIALLPAIASIAWALPVVWEQSQSPYSTNYFYGSGGSLEIARAAEKVIRPGEFYIASKDVAYYLSNKNYVDQDSFWWLLNMDKQHFSGEWFGRPIRVAVIFGRDPFLREQFYAEFEGRYEVREVVGDYALITRLQGR